MGDEEYRWRLFGYLGSIAIVAAVIFFSFLLFYGKEMILKKDNLNFGVSVFAAALILAITYFYTYRFFKDPFYLFICLGWFANVAYLPFATLLKNNTATYDSEVHYLGLVSTILFAISFLTPGNKKPSNHWGIILGVLIGAAGLLTLYYGVIGKLIAGSGITLTQEVLSTFINFVVIFGVGEVFRARLSSEVHGRKRLLLSSTYYGYAALQFAYPFHLETKQWGGMSWGGVPFLVGQLLKVGNAFSILGVLISAVTNRELLSDKAFQATLAQLRERDERLEQRSQLEELGAITSSIEHDIKTPLATMDLNISRMRSRFQHNVEIIEKLNKLDEARKRISATVQVIRFLRGDAAFYNRKRFMEKANMLEVVHRAVKSSKNELRLDPAKYVIKVEGRDVWVRAFTPMLEQVIVNVIKNGIEAIDEAERKRGLVNIHVNTKETPEEKYTRWVKVEVEDNGCGIAAEHIPLLTTLFTTRNDVKPNSGIGLFIGSRFMKIHEGRIEFKSEVGKGTTVTLFLPEWNAYQKAHEIADRESSDDASSDAASDEEVLGIVSNHLTVTKPPGKSGGIA